MLRPSVVDICIESANDTPRQNGGDAHRQYYPTYVLLYTIQGYR